MFDWFNAIGYTASTATSLSTFRVMDCDLQTSITGGIGITLNTGTVQYVDAVLQNVFIVGPTSGAQCSAGIQVSNCGDLTLDHVSTVKTGDGLRVAPGTGQIVQAMYCFNSFFDSGSGIGVNFAMSGTGTVQLAKFVNVWSCTNAHGFLLSNNHAGTITTSEFVNCIGSNNAGGYGFLINDAGVTNTSVIGGSYSANTNGIATVANVTRYKFLGVRAGAAGPFAGNTNGLVLGATNDQFTIQGCDFTNNTTPANITIPAGGTPGQSWFIKDNQGIVTQNGNPSVTLTAAATTTTINHGLAAAPAAQDITLTNVGGWGTAAQFWISGITATQFIINTAANPGAGVNVAWKARLWGQ